MSALPMLIHGDAAFPARASSPRRSTSRASPATRPAARSTSSPTTRSASPPTPREGRSTLYASDLAKGFEIPVVHVNADDPEACLAAVRLAFAYREQFGKDFLIDLIGYRRWGHNEGDEPSFTQPRMYATIAEHPTVRELWADRLVRRGVVTRGRRGADGAERRSTSCSDSRERCSNERGETRASPSRASCRPGTGRASSTRPSRRGSPARTLNRQLYCDSQTASRSTRSWSAHFTQPREAR